MIFREPPSASWLCIAVLGLAVLLIPAVQAEDDSAWQAEVARRGAAVMPFALEKTQHQFSKTDSGGVQRVIARDPQDRKQIRLIRQHLRHLAASFKRGDFSGPEAIHGADMPGLATLRNAQPGRLHIRYRAEPAGASLTFHSDDPALTAAVHAWFEAQLHDHGHDATALHHLHHH